MFSEYLVFQCEKTNIKFSVRPIVLTFQAFKKERNDVHRALANYGKTSAHSCKTNYFMTFKKTKGTDDLKHMFV